MMDPKSAFARIQISDVFEEQLSDISADDARAEGYPTIQSYLDAFAMINRLTDWSVGDLRKIKVWVVKFEVVESMRF